MPNKSSPHGGSIVEGTISHGTLRPQDLLRAFADEYARLLPFNSFPLVQEAKGIADCLDEGKDDFHDAAIEVIDQLHSELDYLAEKEGFYFGTLEGDASDFGFWRSED